MLYRTVLLASFSLVDGEAQRVAGVPAHPILQLSGDRRMFKNTQSATDQLDPTTLERTLAAGRQADGQATTLIRQASRP